MGNDTMDLAQLASLLRRDQRELDKLASRGQLPGRKVGGAWRFANAEIQQWLEAEMPGLDEDQLKSLEEAHPEPAEPLITNLLAPDCVELPLQARTPASVIRAMVRLAEQSWQVYDPDAVLTAVQAREERGSTAQETGVAVLHPPRPLVDALGESVVAFGRTASGVPFGSPKLTDLFFLVCCRDQKTHLRVLARLSRLFLRPEFLDALRAADGAAEALQVIRNAEKDLLAAV
ncbi:MAG TPA: PTS sugar transporter subunit IIA [Gemmataceae bacterium]|nr:PTS sugar transporter subunit IIA [Gemmataceae bacterium]